jgi:hypothetical protein
LRPAWPSWIPIFARLCAVHEVDDALPGGDVLGGVHARAAGEMRPRAHVGHLRDDEARAAHGAAPEMDQVEVADRAVLGRVHAHGRDDHAVFEHQLAQAEGREHRRRGRIDRDAALRGARAREPAVDAAT